MFLLTLHQATWLTQKRAAGFSKLDATKPAELQKSQRVGAGGYISDRKFEGGDLLTKAIATFACSFCLFAVASAGPRQDPPPKFLLREPLSAGDAAVITEGYRIDMKALAQVADVETKAMPVMDSQEENYSLNVLSTDGKGKATGVKVHFIRERRSARWPGGKTVSRTASLEGKTVTVKRVGGRTVVTVDRGKLAAMDRASAAAASEDELSDLFPDYEVMLGEEWTRDSQDFPKRALGTDANATVTGQLLDQVRKGGHPCVREKLTIELTGRPTGQPFEMNVKMSGYVYFATDIKRFLSINLSGPVSMDGEIVMQGASVAIHGEGTTRVNFSSKWTKVAGKAIKG
jgi:hypothetical protein